MNIEEAIKQLKKHKAEIDKEYISARYSKAIETLLTAYEKEKEKIENQMNLIKVDFMLAKILGKSLRRNKTMLSEEEKNSMELDIETKYVGRTEKEFLNNITYAECLYILDTKNKYCDDIRNLSLLKIVDIVNEQSKEIEELKDKIKAKIEVLDKEEKEKLKGTKGQDRYAIKQEYMHKRSALQSLLEKE